MYAQRFQSKAEAIQISQRKLDFATEDAQSGILEILQQYPVNSLTPVALGSFGGKRRTAKSDLDMLWVANSKNPPESQYIAGKVTEALRDSGFPVDNRLKPQIYRELAITVPFYEFFYKNISDPLQMRMLCEARPLIENDDSRAFLEMVNRLVYNQPPTDLVMRAMCDTQEQRNAFGYHSRDSWEWLKGLQRHVMFILQSLQWRHGYRSENLRTPGVLDAADALVSLGEITPEERDDLKEAYHLLCLLSIEACCLVKELPQEIFELRTSINKIYQERFKLWLI